VANLKESRLRTAGARLSALSDIWRCYTSPPLPLPTSHLKPTQFYPLFFYFFIFPTLYSSPLLSVIASFSFLISIFIYAHFIAVGSPV
jgi:hypothetical protein